MAPYDRNSGSNKTGQAALPHKNIQVKISEKDFNHLMDMAQASGTLEKLNEIYDREMEYMQGVQLMT